MQPSAMRRGQIPVTGAHAARAAVTFPKPRILLVSDDPEQRTALRHVLSAAGYPVEAVAHSGHALLLCRTMRFDLLIAELWGPDMTGPVLAARVRRHCPELAAVYLGAPGTPEGVDNLLVRPFTRDELLERARIAVSGARVTAG